ncbi:MAG TPA: LL-diaminopimelate aminotransferase [Methanothrix sp.]|jgi:LL-diaminopimelate aminotransferase|uniref:LL-diaminopimelate aminotransferase n=1 Tax=Methanothrix sp. TaxID=90426 RepID=UPI002D118D24|nr:LL-diaminopimelate aminotransferase [Methanothrix sp.]MDI9416759.1 LL-diaminopimelate aminotransferase [Euryarchaeota archaeon]HON35729.1 LL-diaminopimelate aminotransferase [Methanothrix sp.]HRU76254.1 LL-diaminopimelate aminotransferase [Methanothrix sp.]
MYADRIKNLPPYLFAGIDKAKQEARARGVDVIDLSVGDPDLPTPDHIVQALKRAVDDSSNHQYPSYEGKLAFRKAVADWYKKTFDVDLDPKDEVLTLIGSKEGIAHAPLAFINPGDLALVPDPAYPVYRTATAFAGGEPAVMPLLKENGFLPDLDAIPAEIARRAKIMFLNYPNNPIGATASRKFFEELVGFARNNDIIIMHDNPYSEIYFDGNRSSSLLEVDGAKDVAVEFHSLSKTYNMTGWRIGSVVGDADVIAGIGKIKSNIDSGTFGAVQDAGIAALNSPREVVDEIRQVYQQRIDILYRALRDIGLELERPRATLYLWAWVGGSSIDYAAELLERTGIVATPGVGFGEHGEGYIRFSITRETKRVEEAARRLEKMKP